MSGEHVFVEGIDIYVCSSTGPHLGAEQDAVQLMGDSGGADWIVIPVSRFQKDFFELSTRMAGFFLQKLMNYQRKVALMGDLSEPMASSKSLRDFVYESNRGHQVWFVEDIEGFQQKLASQ